MTRAKNPRIYASNTHELTLSALTKFEQKLAELDAQNRLIIQNQNKMLQMLDIQNESIHNLGSRISKRMIDLRDTSEDNIEELRAASIKLAQAVLLGEAERTHDVIDYDTLAQHHHVYADLNNET